MAFQQLTQITNMTVTIHEFCLWMRLPGTKPCWTNSLFLMCVYETVWRNESAGVALMTWRSKKTLMIGESLACATRWERVLCWTDEASLCCRLTVSTRCLCVCCSDSLLCGITSWIVKGKTCWLTACFLTEGGDVLVNSLKRVLNRQLDALISSLNLDVLANSLNWRVAEPIAWPADKQLERVKRTRVEDRFIDTSVLFHWRAGSQLVGLPNSLILDLLILQLLFMLLKTNK